jgi:hypothetical protein
LRTEEKIGSGDQKARYRLEGSHCLSGTALSKYCYCPGDGDRSSSRFRPKVSPAPACCSSLSALPTPSPDTNVASAL